MELKQFFKKSRKFYLLALLLLIFTVPVALSGCGGGGGGSSSSSSPASATYTVAPKGGNRIIGATVTMYDLNTSASTPTCQQTTPTSGQYTCTFTTAPSSTDALYITVSGGSVSGSSTTNNSAISLTNLVTPTNNIIPVNELTTVAATDALKKAQFTNVSTGNMPTPPTTNAYTAIKNAVNNITNIADSVHFTSSTTYTAGSLTSTAQNSEQIESLINVLDTLANALSTCVNANTSDSCSNLLKDGGVSNTGTILNVVVNVYNYTPSSEPTLSLTGLSTIADNSSSEFNSGTTQTTVIAPLANTSIPTTSTSTSSSTSSISSAVMYQYATTGSSPYVINEYPINPTTGVVTSSTPQTVTTGQGVLGVAFNENNSYAYAIDGNDNIWVYSANNGILTYSKEYSLSQYLTSANYSVLPNGYADNNGDIITVLNTLYVLLPSATQYGEMLVAIPMNSDGSLDVSNEIAIQDYQENNNYNNFYNFNSSNKFFNNVLLEVYNPTAGAYELNAYSLNSSGMISSATPISTISFSTTSYSNTAPLVTYIHYAPNSGFYFAYTFGNNPGGAGIYNITFNQNGVLTAKQGSIDTANGSTGLFNNVVVPNANYLYYTDNIGNIYVCNNSSSSTLNCSEAESTSSFLPSGYSVNNGQESLFFIGNTLYANATLTSTSGYTNYLFPFTINNSNGSLTLDSGNEIIGGTGTSATSYFGSIYTFYPYNYIFSSVVTANGNTISYSVNPSNGLVDVSNPISSTEVENAGDSYLGDGDLITFDYNNSVGTLNNYLENSGSFNLDGSMALNGIENLGDVLNFPIFTALLFQVNPDENYMTLVYCNEFENVCNNEPPIVAYIDSSTATTATTNTRSIYGIQIGSNSLSAMNSGNAIASYTINSSDLNYAVEIYEFFPSGYPRAEENGIASELNAYSF